MKVANLPTGYYLFGNKGSVWNDEGHIAKNGMSTTLCGRPMLSTNWARIEGMEHAKCVKCNEAYQAEMN